MVGSLLSAALVICVYMAAVGYLVLKIDVTRWRGGNLTPLIMFAPILFLLLRQLSDAEASEELARISGRRMLTGGVSCGIVTLIVAVVVPKLPASIIVFVVAWGIFLITLVLMLKRR